MFLPTRAPHDQESSDLVARSTARRIVRIERDGGESLSDRLSLFFVLANPELMLVEKVLRRAPRHLGDRFQDEVRTSIVLWMESIICRPKSSMDISRLTSGSPSETMLKMLHKAYPKMERALASELKKSVNTTFDHTAFHPTIPDVESQILDRDRSLSEEYVDVREASESVHRLHPGARTAAGARVLHEAFDIPQIGSPATRVQRNEILVAISENPSLLRESLLAKAYGEEQPRAGMGVLWERFTPGQASDLADREDLVIQAVVTAQLSPRPAIPVADLQQLRALVAQGSRNTRWPALSRKLIRAWVGEFTGKLVAVGGSNVEDPKDPAAWLNVTSEVMEFPGKPLGAVVNSPRAVDARLCNMLDHVQGLKP